MKKSASKKSLKKDTGISQDKLLQHLRWAMAICFDKQIIGEYFVVSFEIWIKETEKILREAQ